MNDTSYKQLMLIVKYYNMKEVCMLAGVKYQTYRNCKSDPSKYPLSDENINKLLNTMKNIPKKLESD